MRGSLSFLPSQSILVSSTSSTPSRCWAKGYKPSLGMWIPLPPIVLYATFWGFSQNCNRVKLMSTSCFNCFSQYPIYLPLPPYSSSKAWNRFSPSLFTYFSTHLLLLGHYLFPYVSPSCHCQISRTNCLNSSLLFLHRTFPLTTSSRSP